MIEEKSFRMLEIIATILSSALVLIGIIVTIVHFNKNQTNQFKIIEAQIDAQTTQSKEQHRNNFQNVFWQKQLELYTKASSFAAQLTQHEYNSVEYLEARKGFYTLFWGPMSIVEDLPVKKAMENFSNQLKHYERSKSQEDLDELEQTSFRLARACRESSIKRWELDEFEL